MGASTPPVSHYFRWDGFLPGLADSLSLLPLALTGTLTITFVIFILLFITRRRWIALVVFACIYGFGGGGNGRWGDLPLVVDVLVLLFMVGVMILALIRFGIVGLLVYQLFFLTLANRPFIFNPESIYFEASIAGLLVTLAIVAYGFVVSLGGARFDLGRLLEGSPQK
jgi:hypothetical protein